MGEKGEVEREQGRVHTLLIVASPTPTIGRTYTLQSNGDGHEVDGRVGQRDLDVVGHGLERLAGGS